ncbi:MAG: type II secretion system protein [Bacilli bacterium]|nr:type II secretion system protein [Bacilli bacterium]
MKKGFTLIELLAVIVILAVIALISVPMIMNIIEKTKLGALEDSAYGIIESGNFYYSSNIQNGLDTIEFTCDKNGCVNDDEKLSYKGIIDSGKVKIYSDGKISICIENGKNAAIKNATDTKVTSSMGSCNTTNDEYYIDEVVSLNVYNELKEKYDSLIEKGDAITSDILVNKTAVVQGQQIIGTMENNGILNWNPLTNETKIIEPGYYSGGTISTNNVYNLAKSEGTMSNAGYVETILVQSYKVTSSTTLSLTLDQGTYWVSASINNFRNLSAVTYGLWSSLETSWAASRIYTNDTYYYKVDAGLVKITESQTFNATYTAGATGDGHAEAYTCILSAVKID